MKHVLHITVILAALGLLLWMDSRAKAARTLPARQVQGVPMVTVDSQKDIYGIYRESGLRGAWVVHLNRFLNLVEYLPREETTSMPFPIRVQDARPLYEQGLNAHNWLFIANRTGLVRNVTVVLPGPVFETRRADFEGNFAYSGAGGVIRGYTFDLPMTVTTLDAMTAISEPVIVNVDAGYFGFGEEPARVAERLREKCFDIRLIVTSRSLDEPEIDLGAREHLRQFLGAWTVRR